MSASSVKSADRALRVLELLARHLKPVPTMTIARECDIPRSSTHHLLNVMRDRRFVSYYEHDRAWGLGPLSLDVGSAYMRTRPLQRLAHPRLERLSSRTGHPSWLAVLQEAEVLCIDCERCDGDGPHPAVPEIGVHLPAHRTAVGRAILAQLTEPNVRALYVYCPCEFANGEDACPRSLLDILADVRQAGCAVGRAKEAGAPAAVAAPVFSHRGLPVAAIELVVTGLRAADSHLSENAQVVVDEARMLSRALGCQDAGRL